jgi:truncated hemoglobin YjbI
VRTAGDRSNTYKHWEREFVDQILSKDWKTNVVQKTHIPDALSTGMRMEAIEAIRYGHEEDLTDDEKQLATFIRQAVSGTVTDESWDGMEKRMGTRGVVEYTGFILWLQWIMRMMQALKVNDPSEEEIDKLIADLKADKSKVPDYRVRIR